MWLLPFIWIHVNSLDIKSNGLMGFYGETSNCDVFLELVNIGLCYWMLEPQALIDNIFQISQLFGLLV